MDTRFMKPIYMTEPRTTLIRPDVVRVAVHEVNKAGIGYTVDRTIFGHGEEGETDRTETVGWNLYKKNAINRADDMQDEMFHKRLYDPSMQEEAQSAENADINPGVFVGAAAGAAAGYAFALPLNGLSWAIQYFLGIPSTVVLGASLGGWINERRNVTEPIYKTQEQFNGAHTVNVAPIGYTVSQTISGRAEDIEWYLFRDTAIAHADEMQDSYDDIHLGKRESGMRRGPGIPEAVLGTFLALAYTGNLALQAKARTDEITSRYKQLTEKAISQTEDALKQSKASRDIGDQWKAEYEALANKMRKFSPVYLPKAPDQPSILFNNSRIKPVHVTCTGSMEPTITCRDIVLEYQDLPRPSEIDVGDIVSYRVNESCQARWKAAESKDIKVGETIMHRVIGTTELHEITIERGKRPSEKISPVYILQGDANDTPDPCIVTHDMITGKVVGIIKEADWKK